MSDRAEAVLSVADVASAGRALDVPFTLLLSRADGAGADASLPVRCVSVLRLLPERRLVARVEAVDGADALLKLFIGADAARYCARERHGCERLAEAGVATPALLGEVRAPAGSTVDARGLLFDYLPGAQPLDPGDDAGMAAAAAELGRLHRHGYRHRDLHVDNFLHVDGATRPHLVDGDAVRGRPGALSPRRSLDDLAVLCAQRPPLMDARLAMLLEGYGRGRGWPPEGVRGADLRALAAAVRRQRRARLRRYRRKCQRDCSEFVCEHTWGRYRVAVRDAWHDDLRRLCDALEHSPEALFAGARILKAGNSATVIRVPLGAGTCVVKRYNLKGPWHALRRNLRVMARFRRSWVYGQALHLLEIPSARPLALVERRFGPLRGVAYLVMPDLGNTDLAGEVARTGLSDRRFEQLEHLFRSLAAAELRHGDTKASNFLIADDRLHLVDLDAMRHHAGGVSEDLVRFIGNFPQPGIRQRLQQLKVPGLSL